MDFGIEGSDCWESNAFQDKFIRDYFGSEHKKEQNSSEELGTKKKKGKRKRSDDSSLLIAQEQHDIPAVEGEVKPHKKKKKKSHHADEQSARGKLHSRPEPGKLKKSKKTSPKRRTDDNLVSNLSEQHDFPAIKEVEKPHKKKKSHHKYEQLVKGNLHSRPESRKSKKSNETCSTKRTDDNSVSNVSEPHSIPLIDAMVKPNKKKRKSHLKGEQSVIEELISRPTTKETEKSSQTYSAKKSDYNSFLNASESHDDSPAIETVIRPHKKKKNHCKGEQSVKSKLNSRPEPEETKESDQTFSPSSEKLSDRKKPKKKTRRAKRLSKSSLPGLERSSSSQLSEQSSLVKKKKSIQRSQSFKDKLITFKNKFKVPKKPSGDKETNFLNSSATDLDPVLEKQKIRFGEFLPSLPKSVRSNILKEQAQKMMQAAKFRMLNEKLYMGTGKEALKYFSMERDAFEEYHKGYELQVSKWPVNPVDLVIRDLRKVPTDHVIADLGCGTAKIAATFPDRTVYSYDLVAVNGKVIRCDISKVPLLDHSVDVAVFCLSLMGTNLKEYISDAHRILKIGGLLKIAEVESRIDDIEKFVKSIEAYGFRLSNKDISHKMFVLLDFCRKKVKLKKDKLPDIVLSPCLYKKR